MDTYISCSNYRTYFNDGLQDGEYLPIASGMGTSGFVGQIGTVTAMAELGDSIMKIYGGVLLLRFVLPAILSLFL